MSSLRQISAYGAQAQVRGGRVLDGARRAVQSPTRWLSRALPDAYNPLVQSGPIANTTLLIAVVSGVLLLIWYVPSVHRAYDSVTGMAGAPWSAELMRSLHRYSSDACMFFAILHGFQSLANKRFGGARWLPWVTGFAMLTLLWFLGWTGYWLVWDQRARQVALGTAAVVDVLPIFIDPLSRTFLTNETVSSLLFFLVFFFHMLLPLAMGVGIWLHVMRLSRTAYFTGRVLSAWIVGSLVALSLVLPATTAAPADMQAAPTRLAIDAWYLLPILLTDRLASGALWGFLLVTGLAFFTVPWTLGRRRPEAAVVVEKRCNACETCYNDCPYGAIQMVPRSEGRMVYPTVARVDPALCVGCGICNGSCNSAGVGVPWFAEIDERKRLVDWLGQAQTEGVAPHVAFVCAESAGAHLDVDPETGQCPQLPGFRVMPMPCAGWLLSHNVARALNRGAEKVLVVSCSLAACAYREGADWAAERLNGRREPELDVRRYGERVRLVEMDREESRAFPAVARDFVAGATSSSPTGPSLAGPSLAGPSLAGPSPAGTAPRWQAWAAALPVVLLVCALVYLPSDATYSAPASPASLVVSFKHAGKAEQQCRELSPEEIAALPVHMRRDKVCERGRSAVRMRVHVDGTPVVDRDYAPRGLFGDGNSVALERIVVEPGEHAITVELAESAGGGTWDYRSSRRATFERGRTTVVLFDGAAGFSWH